MVQQKLVDSQRLWELAHQSKDAEENMRELDITEMVVVKSAMKNLVDENGEHSKFPVLTKKVQFTRGRKRSEHRIRPG